MRKPRHAGKFVICKGFTLIELLIVIAIIALLAAILFPAFARAREKARQTACQSNLKQLAMGMLQYSQDYDEHLPFGLYGQGPITNALIGGYQYNGAGSVGGAAPIYGWNDLIFPYVKNTQVYVCPSMANPPGANLSAIPASITLRFENYYPSTPLEYDMNVYLSDSQNSMNDYASSPGIGLSSVAQPSVCLMLTEGNWNYQSNLIPDGYAAAVPIDIGFGKFPALAGGLTLANFKAWNVCLGSGPGAWAGDPNWIDGSNGGNEGAYQGVQTHGNLRMIAYCDGHVKAQQIVTPGVTIASLQCGGGTPTTTTINPCAPFGTSFCSLTGGGTTWSLEAQRLWLPTNTN